MVDVSASVTTDHLRDRDNAAGIDDNSTEIVDIAANVISC